MTTIAEASLQWDRRPVPVVPSNRSVRRILEIAAETGAAWVVLRRVVPWQATPFFYVFRPTELALVTARELPADEALELHETGASAESSDPRLPSRWSAFNRGPAGARIVHLDIDGRPDAIGEAVTTNLGTPVPPMPPVPQRSPAHTEPSRPLGGRGTAASPSPPAPVPPVHQRPPPSAAPSRPGRGAGGGAPLPAPSAVTELAPGGLTSEEPSFDLGPLRSPSRPAPEEPTPTLPVEITLSAQGPQELRVGSEDAIDVQVALRGAGPVLANAVNAATSGADKIVVLLSIQGGALTASGPRLLRVDVPTATEPVSQSAFAVRGLNEGISRVAVIFQQGGTELGTVAFSMRVTASQPSTAKVNAEARGASGAFVDEDSLLILIEEKLLPTGLSFNFKLFSKRLGWDPFDYDSPSLKDAAGSAWANLQRYVGSISQRLTDRVLVNLDDARAFSREIRAIGIDLATQLLPAEMIRSIWAHRDHVGSIHVKSWEPYVPWELARLKNPDTNEEDERYLAEYDLVRSLNGKSRPDGLALTRWRSLFADYPNGLEKALTGEKTILESILRANHLEATPIPADLNALYDALNRPDFDVLHMCCHASADSADIERSALIIGDRKVGTEVKPVSVDSTTVKAEARLDERHPIVFLNACESAKLGPSLTAWAGWPRTFWDAGAGAFVGTSWPVRDAVAKAFSAAFYGALLEGKTLAKAAGAARRATRDLGDATWLAYKVYGYPGARRQ